MGSLILTFFKEQLHTRFQVCLDDSTVSELELTKVTDLGTSAEQEYFSVLFKGEIHPLLPQQTYCIKHRVLGENDVFLVPVGKEDESYLYEAVFNRLKGGDKDGYSVRW